MNSLFAGNWHGDGCEQHSRPNQASSLKRQLPQCVEKIVFASFCQNRHSLRVAKLPPLGRFNSRKSPAVTTDIPVLGDSARRFGSIALLGGTGDGFSPIPDEFGPPLGNLAAGRNVTRIWLPHSTEMAHEFCTQVSIKPLNTSLVPVT